MRRSRSLAPILSGVSRACIAKASPAFASLDIKGSRPQRAQKFARNGQVAQRPAVCRNVAGRRGLWSSCPHRRPGGGVSGRRMIVNFANALTLAIAVLAIAGVIVRPMRWPEAVWAVAGAVAVVALGLVPGRDALAAIGQGLDVYLFLVGMMLLSETARREGLFDWLAVEAVLHAKGSPRRLFLLIFAVGTIVTVFMSNDATAVVLTPAVFAVARRAKLEPLPYLFICAFVANAASFVLPISNPANIVLYGGHMPPLLAWLKSFTLPSVASIVVTYLVLRWRMRHALAGRVE